MTEYFATAPADEFFWWCLGSGLFTIGGFITSFSYLHRARLMENMPTSRLRSAAQGYVELEGKSRLMEGPPVIAPLTLSRCVWWRFRVEEKRGSGKNTKWVTISSGLSDDCFELDDDTGRCIVDPDGARVIPHHRQVWYGSQPRPDIAPSVGKGWLRGAFLNFRYTEERLDMHAPVYALGAYRTQTGIADAFDEKLDLNELLGKWKQDARMMQMLDTNKDGSIDAREWEAARRMALKKVRDEHVQRAVETPDLNILAKPRDGRPYILSGVPQAAMIRRYRWQSAGSMVVAAVAAGILLTALVSRGFIS